MKKSKQKEKKKKVKLVDIDLCAICQNVLYKPTVLLCQHTFCFNCISTYCKKNKWDKKICPLCRFPFVPPTTFHKGYANVLREQFPKEYKKREKQAKREKKADKLELQIRKDVDMMLRMDKHAYDSESE